MATRETFRTVQSATGECLTVEEIRPAELMKDQKTAILTDVGRLLSRYNEFVHVACPACGTDRASPKFQKNGIAYVECAACTSLYVNPRPNPELLNWFYRKSRNYAYWNKVVFPASEAARRDKIFVPRLNRILEICAKYVVRSDALLDIGAGFGTFCVEAQNRRAFQRVVAVEPTRSLAETCRKRGLEVIESPIECVSVDHANGFDVVTSFEVIEHLFDPADFVAHTARLLRPGGILVLTCPNGKGFDVETLGVLSETIDHEHLNYFNPESLTAMLERQGLEVLEAFTPGRLDADLVRARALAGDFDLSAQPFLKRVLIDEWEELGQIFQDFIVQNGLSSNMWLVARNADSAQKFAKV